MKSNLQFRLESPEEQLFHEYFTPAAKDHEGQWMTAAAIFQDMKYNCSTYTNKLYSIVVHL